MDGAFPSAKGEGFGEGAAGPYQGGRGGGRGRGFRGTAENAKTKMCTRWLQGDCRFGDRCNFAHGEQELRGTPEGSPGGPGRGYAGRGRGGFRGGYGGPAGRGYGGRGGYGYGAPQGYGGYGEPAGYGGDMGRPMNAGMPEDVWAAQGHPVPGPNGWYMYRVKETGESYYHNHRTQVTQWDRPADWPAGGPM